jgi:hypothetical protein
MAEISKEALVQLSARGYKEVTEFVSLSAKHWEFEHRFEEIECPTEKDKGRRLKQMCFICAKLSELQLISETENTKPVFPGMRFMSLDEVMNSVLAFADTHYSADKLKSFEEEK